ncbi:hypothetical protein D5S17_28495 [Pseudonocardiaceae bacterium YIM PH 21723]|nr:hypothetical protein D5S17_28495 [Pseudonocardiaceae bacterium YIM PH 21723]
MATPAASNGSDIKRVTLQTKGGYANTTRNYVVAPGRPGSAQLFAIVEQPSFRELSPRYGDIDNPPCCDRAVLTLTVSYGDYLQRIQTVSGEPQPAELAQAIELAYTYGYTLR